MILPARLAVHRRGQMGSGSHVLRLSAYTFAAVNSHLPIALDNQPANFCTDLPFPVPMQFYILLCGRNSGLPPRLEAEDAVSSEEGEHPVSAGLQEASIRHSSCQAL